LPGGWRRLGAAKADVRDPAIRRVASIALEKY